LIKYCESIFKRIYVSPTGDITPCCYINRPLGNIYDSSVSDIWNGVGFNDFRRKFLSNEPEQECINCHNVSYLSIGELYSKINRSNFVFNLLFRLIAEIRGDWEEIRLGTHSNACDHYGCEGETREIVLRMPCRRVVSPRRARRSMPGPASVSCVSTAI
jgi:radical SAM protein with 4Fe4S-binding SPASM domain